MTRLLLALLLLAGAAHAQPVGQSQLDGQAQPDERAVAAGQPLRVGVVEDPPFATRGEDGSWQGLAVNVWRTAAEAEGLAYELVPAAEDALIDDLAAGRLDAGLPVDATPAAAESADLSFPFYTATLAVAEPQRSQLLKAAGLLFSWRFLQIVLSLSALLLVVGAIIWLIERRGNDEMFSRAPAKGLGDGFWWAGVTLTTIGYGDKAPATPVGRGVAMLWMLVGLAVSSSLTAAVVSAAQGAGGAPDDPAAYAQDREVGVVAGSVAERYMQASEASAQGFPTLQDAVDAVRDGQIDAVIANAPALKAADTGLKVRTTEAEPILVTIALRRGSPLAPALDRHLVERTTTPGWWKHVGRWVPPDDA